MPGSMKREANMKTKEELKDDVLFLEDLNKVWMAYDLHGPAIGEMMVNRLARRYNTSIDIVKEIGGF